MGKKLSGKKLSLNVRNKIGGSFAYGFYDASGVAHLNVSSNTLPQKVC